MASCVMMSQGAIKESHQQRRLFSETSAAALIELRYIAPTLWFLPSDYKQCFVCLKCFRLSRNSSPKAFAASDTARDISQVEN